MEKLVREVGPWVDKERFWDREAELENLLELLDEGANILISAPRRIGKTSLIREAENRIGAGYCCLQLDLQKSNSPADIITELSVATRPHMKLWRKTKEVFKNVISSAAANIDSLNVNDLTVKLRDGLLADWQDKGDRMIDVIAGSDVPAVIFMDEFPLVINRLLKGTDYTMTPERLKEAETFLSWIRAVTIKYRKKIRMVITGSIGLEPILQQARLSHTINTFTPFEVDPWDAETAAGCLYALANNYGVVFGEGAVNKMIEHIGSGIPHHVQMYFSHIYDDCKRRNDIHCSAADAGRVYNRSMLSTRGHAELTTYEERLSSVLNKKMLPLALEFLTEASVTGMLTADAAMIISLDFGLEKRESRTAAREILTILEHDGYLRRSTEGYVFASRLIRDWWRARFGFQYIPAAERGEE